MEISHKLNFLNTSFEGRNLVTTNICCLPVLLYSEKHPYYCALSYFLAFLIIKLVSSTNEMVEHFLRNKPSCNPYQVFPCVFQWSCHKCMCTCGLRIMFYGSRTSLCLRHSPHLCWYCHDLCTCVFCAEVHAVWESDLPRRVSCTSSAVTVMKEFSIMVCIHAVLRIVFMEAWHILKSIPTV